jgi:hypothetical protein
LDCVLYAGLFKAPIQQTTKREKRAVPFIITSAVREVERRGITEVRYEPGPSSSGRGCKKTSKGKKAGSISQRYVYGSGSFYHQVKIIRKTLIPAVLWLLLKNYVNVPSKSNKLNFFKLVFVGVLKVTDENISQRHGSADPDPHQNIRYGPDTPLGGGGCAKEKG